MRRILRPFSATVSGPPLSPWQVSVPCKVGHLDQYQYHHQHDPSTDHHLSPGTQLAGGGGGAKEAAALLARRAQHLGKENMMWTMPAGTMTILNLDNALLQCALLRLLGLSSTVTNGASPPGICVLVFVYWYLCICVLCICVLVYWYLCIRISRGITNDASPPDLSLNQHQRWLL